MDSLYYSLITNQESAMLFRTRASGSIIVAASSLLSNVYLGVGWKTVRENGKMKQGAEGLRGVPTLRYSSITLVH